MPNKFLTYNGKEFEEALGLNMHEMDMRHYDPAIGRWVVQDPVTHHSMSPYNAFDNNPVFWADPSGADAQFDTYNQSYDGDNIAWVLNYSGESASDMVEFNNKAENRSDDRTTTNTDLKDDPGKDYQKLFAAKAEKAGEYLTALEHSDGLRQDRSTADFSRTRNALGVGSILYSTGELLIYNKEWGYWLGTNGKYYSTNWGGNQWTGSRSSALRTSNLWRYAGKGVFILGAAFSTFEGINHFNDGNYPGAARSTIDVAMGRVGFVGPWGAFFSGIYFGSTWAVDKGYINPKEHKRDWTKTCFVAGTKILLKDGTVKNIEDIVEGDEILSVNISTMEIESDLVLIVPEKDERYNKIYMKYDNGTENISSAHHPFYVKNKGWAVYDVEMAKQDLTFDVKQLELGDIVYYYADGVLKETKIIALTDQKEDALMYNIKYVKKNNTFFANGIVVHNRFEN